MARSLHVRLDETSASSLAILRAAGMSDSEAVRLALNEAAAKRRRRAALREESRALAANAEDREEIRIIMEQMDALAPDWPT
jgi:hypothetical protein